MTVRTHALGALFVLASTAWAPKAAHADEVDACVDAADRGQQLRDQGKLIGAREQLLLCGVSTCPGAVAKQCVRWLHEVDDQLPTLSLRVRDGVTDVTDVEVLVDDVSRMTALDGRPITIDPGPHRLAFRRGNVTVEQSLVARAAEKNRLVDVQLSKEIAPVVIVPPVVIPPPAVQVEHRGFQFPWTAGVFLGVSVVAFAATLPLVIVAGNDASNLRQTCAPMCSSSSVDDVRTKLVIANVTFGIGIAGLATTALFIVLANTRRRDRAVSLGVAPVDHGVVASAVGAF
jgi:hypothetical protein